MTTLPTWLVVVLVLVGPVVAGITIAASSALLRERSRQKRLRQKRLIGLRREPERAEPRGTASGGPREEATERPQERRGFFSRLFGG
jgi:hypothetical protein